MTWKYDIYAEMESEFKKEDYPHTGRVLCIAKDGKDPGTFEYEYSMDLPYGKIECDYFYDNKGRPEDELDLKPFPEKEKDLLNTI
jgi:hypothetical protein